MGSAGMTVEQILAGKGHEVYAVSPESPLQVAAAMMLNRSIGALVCDDGASGMVGIISERDVARAMALYGADAVNRSVRQCMSRDLIACQADDKVEHLLAIMTETHCRHLPVLREGKVIGLVSIGDLVKAEHHF